MGVASILQSLRTAADRFAHASQWNRDLNSNMADGVFPTMAVLTGTGSTLAGLLIFGMELQTRFRRVAVLRGSTRTVVPSLFRGTSITSFRTLGMGIFLAGAGIALTGFGIHSLFNKDTAIHEGGMSRVHRIR